MRVMRDMIVIKRYADAYMGFARGTCGLDKAIADFKRVKDIMRENPEFLEFLMNPEITFNEKHSFLEKVLSFDFAKEFVYFLKLLLEKERMAKISDIADYVRVAYSHGEEEEAVLRTSYPIDLEILKEIERKMEEVFKKKFKFYLDLDGNLLGGIQIIIGNTVLDGSVRRKIDDLREKLMTVRI